ncbi:MAG: glycosyltransferase family 4 protein [Bryobacteraceae bacterium]
MRILYFSSRECWPLNTGARLRDFHLASQLARRGEVVYLGLRNPKDPPPVDPPVDAGFAGFQLVEKNASFSLPNLVRGFAGPVPVTLLNNQSSPARAALVQLLRNRKFDSAQIEGVHLLPYVDVIRQESPGTAIIADWHNIESEIMWRYSDAANPLKKLYARRTARLIEEMETILLRRSDAHTMASQREKATLGQRVPGAVIHVIGNGVDVAAHASDQIDAAWTRAGGPEPVGGNVLFVGSMDYHANIHAALQFGREVWPMIRNRLPGSQFLVVGRNPSDAVKALAADPGIRVTGTVDDVRAFYYKALAVVVPLRIGSGTRLKILEAMAAGVPVVSTALGAEGIDVTDEKDILIAESPDDFVAAITRLAASPDLARSLGDSGRALVASHYDWPALGEKLFRVHCETAERVRGRATLKT